MISIRRVQLGLEVLTLMTVSERTEGGSGSERGLSPLWPLLCWEGSRDGCQWLWTCGTAGKNHLGGKNHRVEHVLIN